MTNRRPAAPAGVEGFEEPPGDPEVCFGGTLLKAPIAIERFPCRSRLAASRSFCTSGLRREQFLGGRAMSTWIPSSPISLATSSDEGSALRSSTRTPRS